MRRNLQSEGPNSLLSFAVRIKQTDPKKHHVVNRNTLQSLAPFLQKQHVDLVFKELSENQNEIDYSVLIYDLKGQTEEERTAEIEGVFNHLDDRREGEFPINYMIGKFLSKANK
ncbi:MAG: hypothetical protein KDD45_07055 [Bdellovibrionales bacterium]|nr:hypothetical protein [Bdellovibrionales bacterium]